MITSERGLHLSLEQLQRAYTALAALRAEHPNAKPEWLAVLAEGFIDHARQVQQEIEQYTGIASIAEARAELWLAIDGRRVGAGEGPSSILTAVLDAFRKGVQAAPEFLPAGQLARRPTAALKNACDWRILAFVPGSMKVGIRLPDMAAQQGLWDGDPVPAVRRAVREFLEVAAWAASDQGPEPLADQFPDPNQRRLLLNAVKPFVPRPRGDVERVSVSGRALPDARPIVLTRAASERIDRAIDRIAAVQVEDHVGELREIDLDNLTMAVRNAGDVREVRCTFEESLLEAAKEALDCRVKISGVRQARGGRRMQPSLHVFRLEVLDEEGTEGESAAEGNGAASA
jgi:hypothetical protein